MASLKFTGQSGVASAARPLSFYVRAGFPQATPGAGSGPAAETPVPGFGRRRGLLRRAGRRAGPGGAGRA